MKIVLINGSPKTSRSNSGTLLMDLKKYLVGINTTSDTDKPEIEELSFNKTVLSENVLTELQKADVLVYACPLYVDGIPAHLLSCLIQLESVNWQTRQLHVYGIVNCGFYEGIQAEPALNILQNWCTKAGLIWGGGIGVGGGGALQQMPTIENGHGPKAPVEKALFAMADTICQHRIQENSYVSVAFPRFLYKMAAQMGWRKMVKANGGKVKDLGKHPD
ncbi:MAG: NAD(P)H-dependent oxidoreductase [Lachnospiraceae bacterium]|nr:NAD(P)H-dependent oxidoreductase [Lachnospiraceae bacterium]